MSDTRLVICGSIAIDRIMNFNGSYHELIEPSKLKTLSVSVLADSLEVARGGNGANISHNLATLGDRPILLGSVGEEDKQYLEDLSSDGVDITNVHISHLPTAAFNVLTDITGNQVGGFYPGAMSDSDSLSFLPWAEQDALACICAHDPPAMRRQVQECASNDIRLFYDPGQQVSNISGEDLTAGITAAQLLIVNDYEHGLLLSKTGFTDQELLDKVPVLVITKGKEGSVIAGNQVKTTFEVDSAAPSKIADPTGAGDAYRAGFLYGYLRQWELDKCGQLGSVVASFALEQHGTQVNFDRQAIIDRYKETFREEIGL